MWMGGMHAWPAAYNAGWISLRSPPAPRNSLPEYKCIPASLQKTATINATDQPVTGLPLNCTQRQKWIDFVFYLKVNQIAVHFSRKSSPYQTLNTPPKKKKTKPTNHSTLYQQLCPKWLLEVRTREEKTGSCHACPARLDHQQASQERQGTIPPAICKVEHVTGSNKREVSRDAKEDNFWHQSQTLSIVSFSERKPVWAFVSPLVQL